MSTTGTGAREQVGRMLALVPYLNARGTVHVEEAARDLGLTPQQIVKDLHVLFMCGLPGGYPDDLIDVDISALVQPDGDRLIRMSNADYLDRPLRLSPTEASALVVALRVVRGSAEADARDVVDRVLHKLEAALGDEAAIDAGEDGSGVDPAADVRAQLEQAVAAERQVLLRYHVPSRDEVVERTVDPHLVTEHGNVAYLDAWCHAADAPRTFRVDRIVEARTLDSAVRVRADATATGAGATQAEATFEPFVPPADSPLATLLLDAEVRWLPDYLPVVAQRERADGRSEVDLHVVDPRWLVRLVSRHAPHVSVLAPAELASAFTARAQETLSLYA
ncbi:helix-turn-helix transcriptional regulator [Nocardioides zeae]|uniref:Proteasome accessory factor C n=1 Tax=Nocardioides zeae TaxID=1457234 RepID=A0AAJ1TY46_9ACTN|nr:WYL domain-containing protein [Nocardioides zeae]MDQ1104150.1 proteasome accessory factor C [Nocardioides zeae]